MLSSKTKQLLGPLFPIANRARLMLLRAKYRGQGVVCVCCGSHFKKFAPFGSPRRRMNAWCPSCQSLERDRLLWMFLEKNTDLYKKPVRLLHIAPERLFFHRFKHAKNIEYYPADKFPNAYPAGTKYLDILETGLGDNSYDVIICNHVFQYIENDRKAMCEIFRILKPGGWAILQVPIDHSLQTTYEDFTITDPRERAIAFGLAEHVRFYGPDYAKRLQEAGFSVRAEYYSESFSDDEIFTYGFWKGDPIYICSK